MKCFYHNDADGKCSAYWVRFFLGNIIPIEFISMDYLKSFPIQDIKEDEEVYIVDYSIPSTVMESLLSITKNVTWIDHHKTAINRYITDTVGPNLLNTQIRGIRDTRFAACMLTYCYFRHMTCRGTGSISKFEPWMIEDAPLFTKLISDWDTWTLAYGDRTRCFLAAFNAGDFDPDGKDWGKSPSLPTETMIRNGKAMLEFRDGWAKDYLDLGFETIFHGYKCFALNLGHCSSEYFKSLQAGKYDIYIAFVFNGIQYSVSLYSTVVDVSRLALGYGGGGHTGAAGFVCEHLPFQKLM